MKSTTPEYDPALLHHVLGDPVSRTEFRISEWVSRTDQAQKSASGTSSEESFRTRFEYACALLYDSRTARARRVFLNLVKDCPEGNLRALVDLGLGRCSHFNRAHPRSEIELRQATERAAESGDAPLKYVADMMLITNSTDYGASPISTGIIDEIVQPPVGGPLGQLLEGYRVFATSRVHLRHGNIRRGLASFTQKGCDPAFAGIAPIPRGHFIRMYGIMLAICGYTRRAIEELKESFEIFTSIDYKLGMVQAAGSMARVQASRAEINTSFYLDLAFQIINEPQTDPPGVESDDRRQMPGEHAVLYSRRGDYELARGNFEQALDFYRRDMEVTDNDLHEALRSKGYPRRGMGRALRALGRLEEAEKRLRESVECFEQVEDRINAFFSRAFLCETLLERGKADPAGIDAAKEEIPKLQDALEDRKERQVERAIVLMLEALVTLRGRKDTTHASAIIEEAKDILRSHDRTNDAYFTRALIIESEIRLMEGDSNAAIRVLREAVACSANFEMRDLRVQIDQKLGSLGIDPHECAAGEIPRLQRICQGNSYRRMDLAVFFADLRGFTAACQRVEPKVMADFISKFAEQVSRCVCRCEGHPVRFLGDCVMAVFDQQSRRSRPKEILALKAACEFYQEFDIMKSQHQEVFEDPGSLGVGFGISNGLVTVGRFGNERLAEFSAIGNATNLASRMQGNAENAEVVIGAGPAEIYKDHLPTLTLSERELDLKGIGRITAYVVDVREASRLL